MTPQNKFFDEQAETVWVGPEAIVIRLRSLLELETEVHLMSLKTNLGATFRTIWLNTQTINGFRAIGLELVEAEGDLWAAGLPAPPPVAEEVITQTWLECQRCHQKDEIPLPEVPGEFISEGLVIGRNCGKCRATTPWGHTQPDAPAEASPAQQPASGAGAKHEAEQRSKGRATIRMPIKVIKRYYGYELEDVGETINISRTGVYFRTKKTYEKGENVQVVLPYNEGDIAIRVFAKVVRQDQLVGTWERGVALYLEK